VPEPLIRHLFFSQLLDHREKSAEIFFLLSNELSQSPFSILMLAILYTYFLLQEKTDHSVTRLMLQLA
jgi:hypothetical protein